LYGQRRIVEQDVLLGNEGYSVMLSDQERGKTGAVNENVTGNRCAGGQLQCCDVVVFRRYDPLDVPQLVLNAQIFNAVALQQFHKFAGVQVVTVVEIESVLWCLRFLGGKPSITHATLRTNSVTETWFCLQRLPVRSNIERWIAAGSAKGVVIGLIAPPGPASELGTLFEAGITAAQEISFRHADAA
jgi:hypothetical protein